MTYYPKPAPRRRFLHADWRTGFRVNSRQGTDAAAAEGYTWVDNDMHRSADGTWVNGHGSPEKTWGRPRFESRTWKALARLRYRAGGRTYRLRSGAQTIRDNARRGISTEFEVKDLGPKLSETASLDAAFARLAIVAAEAYGPQWRRHLVVKVLTNLSGGLPYALKVCHAAHKAGIPTMILARGRAVYETFAGHTEVTYVRGSKVLR